MTTAPVPLTDGSTASIESRKIERRRVRIRALVREAGSCRIDIDVVDLSPSGFRFESFYGFAPGARVFLSIPSLQPLEAIIAWRGGNAYGCQLIKPLHAAVFETIANRFG
jgi:PilZ domain